MGAYHGKFTAGVFLVLCFLILYLERAPNITTNGEHDFPSADTTGKNVTCCALADYCNSFELLLPEESNNAFDRTLVAVRTENPL